MNIEYSCLMPTVYDYTQSLDGDAAFFGFLLATFSITRMLVFIPIGWWADVRPFREVFAFTAFVGLIGCFIYGAAGALGNKWWLVVGRVLTGLGAANTTLSRTYISKCVEADQFAKVIGVQMTLDLFGVMIGPALIAGITKVNFDYGWFHFNEQTAPGYIMAVLQFFMLVSFLTTFVEPPPQDVTQRKTIRRKSLEASTNEDVEAAIRVKSDNKRAIWRVLVTGGGWFFILTTFTVNFNLCALETVATPLMEKQYDWHSIENSSFFAACAFVGMVAMLTGMWIDKNLSGRKAIALGFTCMLSAFGIWLVFDGGLDLPKGPFLLGSAICIFGLCVLTPANSAYFTKVVEYQGGAQGLFGGIWSVFMSAGKSAGPIVAGYALNLLDTGTGNWIIFVLCVPVLAINVLCLPFIAKTMKDMDSVTENLAEENRRESQSMQQSNESFDAVNTSLLKDFTSDDEKISQGT
ncbi:hypothetical protein TrVE_jg9647 [Triparma verrucosa]|nr:hypothetical protein TrVE_jg9647 [Triparma verrucosa]